MAPSAEPPTATKSGIRKLSNGESVIPASTRADGSVRKEIRVKPGYRPPEDVEVYKNRTAEAWKNRGKGGVPGAEPANEEKSKTAPAAGKNAKRREARKKAAATAEEDGLNDQESAAKETLPKDGKEADDALSNIDQDPDAEKAKEARKLAKKLRQARDLQNKKEKGDSMLPEQILKITRINEIVRQLESLGFDQEGEKKDACEGVADDAISEKKPND